MPHRRSKYAAHDWIRPCRRPAKEGLRSTSDSHQRKRDANVENAGFPPGDSSHREGDCGQWLDRINSHCNRQEVHLISEGRFDSPLIQPPTEPGLSRPSHQGGGDELRWLKPVRASGLLTTSTSSPSARRGAESGVRIAQSRHANRRPECPLMTESVSWIRSKCSYMSFDVLSSATRR